MTRRCIVSSASNFNSINAENAENKQLLILITQRCAWRYIRPYTPQVKMGGNILFTNGDTQRIRSRFVDVECPAGRAGRVRFAPTPVQNAVWSIGRRRGRRTTSICTIFLRTL